MRKRPQSALPLPHFTKANCAEVSVQSRVSHTLLCTPISWAPWSNAGSASVDLGWGLRVYISNQLPGDTHAARARATLESYLPNRCLRERAKKTQLA